ncbi:MAG: TldD/PmbA family protein [Bdellovibrionia bacterium]
MPPETSTFAQRATFSTNLNPLRHKLSELLPILEAQSEWYGSIFLERKSSKNFSANLKQTQLSDQTSMGVVFRIYDGYTLFEEATDDLEISKLEIFVQSFVKRIKARPILPGTTKTPYSPPSWKERLSVPLENEITSQLPKNLSPQIPVHFGIRFSSDPRQLDAKDYFDNLRKLVLQCKTQAAEEGFTPEELTYVVARTNFTQEESIFIDRETNMSQTLYRLSLSITTMAGSDRTFCRIGGLGGTEAIQLDGSEIKTMLKDLKALRSADRITPGKYRVLFGPVLTGVLAHEAFGHSQEADTCARGRSKAWELHKSGQIVGNQHATILNNPAIFENAGKSFGAWGSYFFDEEGWLSREQVLLDQGKLLPPMTNLTSAIRLKIPRTANGKRESWANGVYTRQTNTYFSAGNKMLAELMTGLGSGFLALHPAGGMEDPKGMGIQVGISFVYEVEGGKLTGRVFKGPAGGDIQMTGYTPDILNSIVDKSKVDFDTPGPDYAKYPFNDVGGCGKYHKEFVFAGCGGPYVLLDRVILG